MPIDKALNRGYVLSPLAAPHHRRERLILGWPADKDKAVHGPSPDGGRSNNQDDLWAATRAPAHYAYPRGQSRSSGTAPGAPDRRDRRVAKGGVRPEASDGSVCLNRARGPSQRCPVIDRPARDADDPIHSGEIVRPRGGSDFASANAQAASLVALESPVWGCRSHRVSSSAPRGTRDRRSSSKAGATRRSSHTSATPWAKQKYAGRRHGVLLTFRTAVS